MGANNSELKVGWFPRPLGIKIPVVTTQAPPSDQFTSNVPHGSSRVHSRKTAMNTKEATFWGEMLAFFENPHVANN